MSSNYFRLKKIKINIDYKGRVFTTDIQPYKTLKYIKDQAKNYFYPITENVRIVYQNKDLTSYESNMIGDYFKKRTTIALRLLPCENKQSQDSRRRLNDQLNNNPAERNCSYMCVCEQGIIEYYCRSCKEFICNSCRMSTNHLSHNVVQVDTDNLEESTKLYAITLQADILHNVKATRDYYIKFQNQNFIEAASRQEILFRKIEKIQQLYKQMIDVLSFNENNMNKIEVLLEEFNTVAKHAHGDLETILTAVYQKYTKSRSKMTYQEMKDLYEIINDKEKAFEEDSSSALAYKVNYEINSKIDTMYNKLEEIVDDVLNSKIPFGIELNSYYTYEMIKNKNKHLPLQISEILLHNKQTDKSFKDDSPKAEVKKEENKTKPKQALMKVSAASIQFKDRYIINAKDRNSLEFNDAYETPIIKESQVKNKDQAISMNELENQNYDQFINMTENKSEMNELPMNNQKNLDELKQISNNNNKQHERKGEDDDDMQDNDMNDQYDNMTPDSQNRNNEINQSNADLYPLYNVHDYDNNDNNDNAY